MRVGLLTGLLVVALGSGAVALDGQEPSQTGHFGPAGSLAEARYAHTATLLHDGRVLIVGGDDFPGSLSSTEVWDPATAAFAPADSLTEGRGRHTATLLADGRVLVIGGWAIDGLYDHEHRASAEVWDPTSSAFSAAGSMAQARSHHTATLLTDGRVLVVGGFGITGEDYYLGDINLAGTSLASAEVWDPHTATFSPAGSLAVARDGHTATPLPDGRVLVIGGNGPDAEYVALAEVWDPATEAFSPAGSLAVARDSHSAALLQDGRVLVVGGWSGDQWELDEWDHTASAEVWDPATNTFSSTSSLARKRADHTATSLPDGRVLVIGGGGEWGPRPSTEVWDPVTETFSPAASLAVARGLHTATLLPDGRVLVAGGSGDWDQWVESEVWEPGR